MRVEVERLRRDIHSLKESKETPHVASLIESMERLHGVLEKMLELFENANREIIDEYSKGMHRDTSSQTHAKLDQLISQNEKIARGMVALADIVKIKTEPAKQFVQAVQTPPAVAPSDPFTFTKPQAQPQSVEELEQVVPTLPQAPPMQQSVPKQTSAPLPSLPSLAGLPPLNTATRTIAPPEGMAPLVAPQNLPPPPAPSPRRSLLDKFSFR